MKKKYFPKKSGTSWEKSSGWYNKLVGKSGHYYHEKVIIPGVIRILGLKKGDSLLDIGCGQGVLARAIPKDTPYLGVDLSYSLIKSAKIEDKIKGHEYLVMDATKPMSLPKKDFSHATIILALQNMENAQMVFKNAAAHLKPGAKLVVVLNHPMFRIPRQSGWDVNNLVPA